MCRLPPSKNDIQDASDIVLHDDNFSSVVKGMEQGPGFEDSLRLHSLKLAGKPVSQLDIGLDGRNLHLLRLVVYPNIYNGFIHPWN